MDELKPCPFCGGEAQLRVFGWIVHKEHYGVRCLNCFAQTMDFYESEEEAIKAWNTRIQIPCEMCPQVDNPDSFIFHLLQIEH